MLVLIFRIKNINIIHLIIIQKVLNDLPEFLGRVLIKVLNAAYNDQLSNKQSTSYMCVCILREISLAIYFEVSQFR